jgi:Family of unknown function (DUF6064)
MSEWWTYSPSEFLLFSPRTYYRLFELYNRAIWPAQIMALAIGTATLGLLRSRAAWQRRLVMAILAGSWLWVAWAYLLARYDSINWVGSYFAAGFAVQAALLLWRSTLRAPAFKLGPDLVSGTGLTMSVFAILLFPLIAPAMGRPWMQAEIFGIAPDPTVIATLGTILLASGRVLWELLAIPLIWCAVSGLTLWVMNSPDAPVPLVAGLLAAALAIRKSWSGTHPISTDRQGPVSV